MSEAIEPAPMPRTGTLYAFSTVHVAAKKWNKPMCIGYVDLPNGARVFTHLEGQCSPSAIPWKSRLGVVGEDENGPIETFVFKRARHEGRFGDRGRHDPVRQISRQEHRRSRLAGGEGGD